MVEEVVMEVEEEEEEGEEWGGLTVCSDPKRNRNNGIFPSITPEQADAISRSGPSFASLDK